MTTVLPTSTAAIDSMAPVKRTPPRARPLLLQARRPTATTPPNSRSPSRIVSGAGGGPLGPYGSRSGEGRRRATSHTQAQHSPTLAASRLTVPSLSVDGEAEMLAHYDQSSPLSWSLFSPPGSAAEDDGGDAFEPTEKVQMRSKSTSYLFPLPPGSLAMPLSLEEAKASPCSLQFDTQRFSGLSLDAVVSMTGSRCNSLPWEAGGSESEEGDAASSSAYSNARCPSSLGIDHYESDGGLTGSQGWSPSTCADSRCPSPVPDFDDQDFIGHEYADGQDSEDEADVTLDAAWTKPLSIRKVSGAPSRSVSSQARGESDHADDEVKLARLQSSLSLLAFDDEYDEGNDGHHHGDRAAQPQSPSDSDDQATPAQRTPMDLRLFYSPEHGAPSLAEQLAFACGNGYKYEVPEGALPYDSAAEYLPEWLRRAQAEADQHEAQSEPAGSPQVSDGSCFSLDPMPGIRPERGDSWSDLNHGMSLHAAEQPREEAVEDAVAVGRSGHRHTRSTISAVSSLGPTSPILTGVFSADAANWSLSHPSESTATGFSGNSLFDGSYTSRRPHADSVSTCATSIETHGQGAGAGLSLKDIDVNGLFKRAFHGKDDEAHGKDAEAQVNPREIRDYHSEVSMSTASSQEFPMRGTQGVGSAHELQREAYRAHDRSPGVDALREFSYVTMLDDDEQETAAEAVATASAAEPALTAFSPPLTTPEVEREMMLHSSIGLVASPLASLPSPPSQQARANWTSIEGAQPFSLSFASASSRLAARSGQMSSASMGNIRQHTSTQAVSEEAPARSREASPDANPAAIPASASVSSVLSRGRPVRGNGFSSSFMAPAAETVHIARSRANRANPLAPASAPTSAPAAPSSEPANAPGKETKQVPRIPQRSSSLGRLRDGAAEEEHDDDEDDAEAPKPKPAAAAGASTEPEGRPRADRKSSAVDDFVSSVQERRLSEAKTALPATLVPGHRASFQRTRTSSSAEITGVGADLPQQPAGPTLRPQHQQPPQQQAQRVRYVSCSSTVRGGASRWSGGAGGGDHANHSAINLAAASRPRTLSTEAARALKAEKEARGLRAALGHLRGKGSGSSTSTATVASAPAAPRPATAAAAKTVKRTVLPGSQSMVQLTGPRGSASASSAPAPPPAAKSRPAAASQSHTVAAQSGKPHPHLHLPTLFIARTNSQRKRGDTGVPPSEKARRWAHARAVSAAASAARAGSNSYSQMEAARDDLESVTCPPSGCVLVVEERVEVVESR